MTGDNKDTTFNRDIGQKAKVERHEFANENSARQNKLLWDMAEKLNPAPKAVKHLGSFAVHVYQSEHLKQLFFVKQTLVDDCEEIVASKAFEDLRGTIMEAYERKRQTKRSGF
jgi:hypothetical protein